MSGHSNIETHKELQRRLRCKKREEYIGDFKFSSCNINGRIMIDQAPNYKDGKPVYEYIAEIYGDIGKTEIDIEVGGTVSSTTIAETYIAIDDMERGNRQTGDQGHNWGQLEVLLANKDTREIHFAIFMDEYIECLDNYLTIKLPDYDKEK